MKFVQYPTWASKGYSTAKEQDDAIGAVSATILLVMGSAFLGPTVRAQDNSQNVEGGVKNAELLAPLTKLRHDFSAKTESFRSVANEFVGSARSNDIDRVMELTIRRTIKKRGEAAVRSHYEDEIVPALIKCDVDTEQIVSPIAAHHEQCQEQWHVLMDCRIAGASDGVVDLTVINYGKQGLVISGYEYRAGDRLPSGDKVVHGSSRVTKARFGMPVSRASSRNLAAPKSSSKKSLQKELNERAREELLVYMSLKTMFPDKSVRALARAAGQGDTSRIDLASKISGKLELMDPTGELYRWLERVIETLRSRGIEIQTKSAD